MKSTTVFFVLVISIFNVLATNIRMSLSDAKGYGWTFLSTTPHTVVFCDKLAYYPLSTTQISVTDFSGFKIEIAKSSTNVKLKVEGFDKFMNPKQEILNLKQFKGQANFNFSNFKTVTKIGFYNSISENEETSVVELLKFALLRKDKVEVATILPTIDDELKSVLYWKRTVGFNADIIYNGNYNREIEFIPPSSNNYKKFIIEFSEPSSRGLRLKLSKLNAGKFTNEIVNVPNKVKKFQINIKGCDNAKSYLNKISLLADKKDIKVKIDNILFLN